MTVDTARMVECQLEVLRPLPLCATTLVAMALLFLSPGFVHAQVCRSSELDPVWKLLFKQVLADESDYYAFDPCTGLTHKPNARRAMEWPEHPKGKWIAHTNNLGLREAVDTKVNRPNHVRRILVTGDSHIDGVVPTYETFPKVLESILNSSAEGKTFEVLNGGVGYYGPDNYEAFLRKYAYLKPDHLVVVIYLGNDIIDSLKVHMQNSPPKPKEYFEKLWTATKQHAGSVYQGLNQVFHLKRYPETLKVALGAIEANMSALQKHCAKTGTGLIVVLLPSKMDAEPGRMRDVLQRQKTILGLNDADLAISGQIRRDLQSMLTQKDILFWDSTPEFLRSTEELFWRSDYHLNTWGHRLLAERFHDRFKAVLLK